MLTKLLNYCKKYFQSSNHKHNDYSVTLSIQPDYDLDIKFNFPNLDNCDIRQIPENAEKYAQLLVYINSPIFKHKLLTILVDKSNTIDNIKEKLFFDNILSFHDIILQDIKSIKSQNSPLIKPSNVFNIK
jgi:hypothetical protein